MNRKVGDMLWPAPGVEMDKLEWRIRYGWMSREDFLEIAAIIAAYRQMIFDSRDKRQAVVRELRKGPDKERG